MLPRKEHIEVDKNCSALSESLKKNVRTTMMLIILNANKIIINNLIDNLLPALAFSGFFITKYLSIEINDVTK